MLLRIKEACVCSAHFISGKSSQNLILALYVSLHREAWDAYETHESCAAKSYLVVDVATVASSSARVDNSTWDAN